jgi:hypothetical protein
VLSLFFKAVLGIQRVFHFDSIDDIGFAWLTGGNRPLTRDTLGSLVRAASTRAVNAFVRMTRPPVAGLEQLMLSIDEHVVPRFTRKFLIPKGFHTIRNKKMRAEKLYFSYDTQGRLLYDLDVTAGNSRLARVAARMLSALRRRLRRTTLRVVLDAGAAQNHADLLGLVDANRRHVFLVRAPRRVAYRKRWAALPKRVFKRREEPGRYKRAAPKVIHVGETTTVLRPGRHGPAREVRTVVVREEGRRGKDRWHAIFVFNDEETKPYALVEEFRTRQRHEQAYRIMLHDAFVDTVPSGYNKKSRNPDRPGFRKNAVTLYAWVTGLATSFIEMFTSTLPGRSCHAHLRTVRRWWLNVHADLYLGNDTLIVHLHPRWHRRWWREQAERINAKRIRIPWKDNRRVILSVSPKNTLSEPPSDPRNAPSGVWC